jgi:hypothetical protein
MLLGDVSCSGKTNPLRGLDTKFNTEHLELGAELGRRLAAMTINKWCFLAGKLLVKLRTMYFPEIRISSITLSWRFK